MRLNQAQVRQLSGVREETLRVWRDVLPPLRSLSGRSAQFTFGNVVALTVVKSLVDTFGVKIQKLRPVAHDIFQACEDACVRREALAEITPSTLAITEGGVALLPSTEKLSRLADTALIVPLLPIIDRIWQQIAPSYEPQAQLPLHAPHT